MIFLLHFTISFSTLTLIELYEVLVCEINSEKLMYHPCAIIVGGIASRNCTIRVCKRVQRPSSYSKHWVTNTQPFKMPFLCSFLVLFSGPLFNIKASPHPSMAIIIEFGTLAIIIFCRVIFGMLIALPITLLYYVLLGL